MGLGYGAPFVKLFNSDDEAIESFEIVTKFRYTNSIKINDSSTLNLSSNTIELIDDPNLMPGRKVKFIFGYTSGIVSDKIELYIFDRTPRMDSQGVTLDLELYAKAAYMKLNKGDDVRNDFSSIDIGEEYAKKYGLLLESDLSDERVWESREDFEKSSHEYSVAEIEEFEYSAKIENKVKTSSEIGQERSLSSRFGAAPLGEFDQQNKKVFKHTIKKLASKPQSKNTDSTELDNYLALQEGGPWLASGSGDKLIITKRDFSKEPLKSYHWRRGEGRVQSFSPTENNKLSVKSATSIRFNSWDDELKTWQRSVSSVLDPNEPLLNDEVTTDFKSEDEFREFLLTKDLSILENPDFIIEAQIESYIDRAAVVNTPSGVGLADVDILPDSVKTRVNYRATVHDSIDTIENNAEDSKIQADNLRRAATLDLNSATLGIIGEPNITSNNIIQMVGVGKLYSGKWFVDSVTHSLSNSGSYMTSLALVRNSKGKTENIRDPFTADGQELELNKNNNNTPTFDTDSVEDSERTIE